MTKLKPGDKIDCRIKLSTIVSPYKDYDEIKTFEIIAVDKFGYYLYVPEYFLLKNTIKADKYWCKSLNIDFKFLDVDFTYIQENMISKITSVLDGMSCANCKEFYTLAGANQSNGEFVCFACLTNPYR